MHTRSSKFSLAEFMLVLLMISLECSILLVSLRNNRELEWLWFPVIVVLAALGPLYFAGRKHSSQTSFWLIATTSLVVVANAIFVFEGHRFWLSLFRLGTDALECFQVLAVLSAVSLVIVLLCMKHFDLLALCYHSLMMIALAAYNFYVMHLIAMSL